MKPSTTIMPAVWVISAIQISASARGAGESVTIDAETYGPRKVPLLYAQPATSLLEGIATPKIEGTRNIEFDEWPESLEAIAAQLGTLAAKQLKHRMR